MPESAWPQVSWTQLALLALVSGELECTHPNKIFGRFRATTTELIKYPDLFFFRATAATAATADIWPAGRGRQGRRAAADTAPGMQRQRQQEELPAAFGMY